MALAASVSPRLQLMMLALRCQTAAAALTALAADRRRCMVRCRRPPPPPLPPGRLAFRLAFDSAEVQIVHVNEPTVIESSAYLLKYDSVHGA